MSQGKFSPNYPNPSNIFDGFVFNCYGKIPAEWSHEVAKHTEYDQKTMFDWEGAV